MKKLMAMFLTLALLFSVASVASAEFAPIAKDKLKVGFVYIGDVVDLGYTYAHHQGTLGMMKNLGLTEDQVIWKTNVAEDSSCEIALRELVEQGCNVIFANSFGFMEYVAEMAEEYPDVIFCHCSGYMSNDTNFVNYFGRIYEARYLAGIAAGMKTLETGNNKLGFVAAFTTVPEVVYSLNAYYLGAKSVNPDVTMVVKSTNTWYDATVERQVADALIADGCGILSQHCDTTGPVVACEESKLFAVGYNADVTDVAPNAYLTAPIWNWEAYLTTAVQQVIDGTWKPENVLMGMSDGLVDIAPLTKNVSSGTAEKIEEARAKILDGSFGVFVGPISDNAGNLQVAEGQTLTPAEILGISWFCDGITVA
ncbi:MAG: BMP family ABC transporter substrate-binding protein [Clostridia bacterium]